MAVKPDVISSVSKEMAKLTKYNSSSLLLWGCFLSLTILVWMFGSSGDFSFLLTFAALWRCFGFGLLNYKVWSGMNVRSVSMKTLVLYSTCFSFRLLSMMRHQGKNSVVVLMWRRNGTLIVIGSNSVSCPFLCFFFIHGLKFSHRIFQATYPLIRLGIGFIMRLSFSV